MPSFSRSRYQLFKDFAAALRARRGFWRVVSAFAYGGLCALAFSPVDAVPALWIAFPALIFLLQGTSGMRGAFGIGWCFAFGFFVFDLYWTAASMFVDLKHFWWAVPLAAFALPACFAIYYGIAAALARRFGLQGVSGVVAFVLFWFLADYARGHIFTGFPWNMAGYIWADFLPVLQITSLIGIYGLTLLTLQAACLPACLVSDAPLEKTRPLFLLSLVIIGLCIIWGGERVSQAPLTTVPNVRLRIVQPNVSQKTKWLPEMREDNFQKLLKLSGAPGSKPVTDIIWPETAPTFYLTEDEPHRRATASIIPEGGNLITGVLRYEPDGQRGAKFFNSLITINHESEITATYDKTHLVPFGEYVPLRQWLPIPALAGMGIDFSRGPSAQTLHVAGLPPFSPLICYEVIFPGQVTDHKDRPQLLLNVTNDGWYGHTAGPYQHFAIARVRAVEEGMPLVRAANTGISGIVDSYGRIVTKLDLGQRGFIDGDLPQAIAQPTFFSRVGEVPLWLIFVWLAFNAVMGRFFPTKNRT